MVAKKCTMADFYSKVAALAGLLGITSDLVFNASNYCLLFFILFTIYMGIYIKIDGYEKHNDWQKEIKFNNVIFELSGLFSVLTGVIDVLFQTDADIFLLKSFSDYVFLIVVCLFWTSLWASAKHVREDHLDDLHDFASSAFMAMLDHEPSAHEDANRAVISNNTVKQNGLIRHAELLKPAQLDTIVKLSDSDWQGRVNSQFKTMLTYDEQTHAYYLLNKKATNTYLEQIDLKPADVSILKNAYTTLLVPLQNLHRLDDGALKLVAEPKLVANLGVLVNLVKTQYRLSPAFVSETETVKTLLHQLLYADNFANFMNYNNKILQDTGLIKQLTADPDDSEVQTILTNCKTNSDQLLHATDAILQKLLSVFEMEKDKMIAVLTSQHQVAVLPLLERINYYAKTGQIMLNDKKQGDNNAPEN